MSSNKFIDIDIMSISDKDYLSFISKKNKIHEEIKDTVINRFMKKICDQNNEILELKQRLEETIKNSLIIIKKSLLKKRLIQDNQISLSYIQSSQQINSKQKNGNLNSLIKNVLNIESHKEYHKINKNIAKSFASFNRLNLKKNLKPKLPSNQNNKINNINKNIILFNNELLNGIHTYRNSSRNNINKDLTFLPDMNKTFSIENNKRIESINNYYMKRSININSLQNNSEEKKMALNEDKNKLYPQNSFFGENNCNNNDKVKNLTIHNHRGRNAIRIITDKLKYNKKNKTKKLNSFKKLNLSSNILNNSNICDYCSTERVQRNKEKIKYIFSIQKNIFDSQKKNHSQNNNIRKEYHNNIINKNSFNNNKINRAIKLNKVILKMKEINKNLLVPDFQKINQMTEKIIKKINNYDINKINVTNYVPMTDRFIDNNKNNPGNKIAQKENSKNNIFYYFEDKQKDNSININENFYNNNINKEGSFQAIYNPTFTSFLDRK